jgi:hypothetical protein
MAVREILKYPQVESIVLVDLDPRMTELFAQSPLLRELNADALASPKLKIVNADALQWLEASQDVFDYVVADFPDPSNHALGKLYSTAFYRLLKQHVAETGLVAVQATSPLYARQSYWTVVATLEAAGWKHRALPRAGAQLRRMGLHPRRQARLPAAAGDTGYNALRYPGCPAGAVPLPRRHGARDGRTQPPRQPEPGARVRTRVGQGAGALSA